jgi:MOSC domain-containing protein YiiM
MPIETCEECRFDSRRWNDLDAVTTIRSLAVRWAYTIEGLDPALLLTRPDPTTWSIAEYTDHAREALWAMRFLVEVALNDPGTDLGPAPMPDGGPVPRAIDTDQALDALGEEARLLYEVAAATPPDRWSAWVTIDGERRDVGWTLRHAVHDVSHHLHDIGRIRHRLGAGSPSADGTIDQISVSGGGVPKHAVDRAEVDWSGIVGDTQAARRHHGRPWQALCLWSTEVIAALQAEGHPIHAGATGENLTVSGLDWDALRPGTLVRVGTVLCELSAWSQPCTKNGRWFADGDSNRIWHEHHPGWSRIYATVLEPGVVRTGDVIEVEPVS